jgi:hypothetical protein
MKNYKVTAKQVVLYEKIVEARSEEEAFKIFYETRDEYDIVEDNGLEVESAEEIDDEYI